MMIEPAPRRRALRCAALAAGALLAGPLAGPARAKAPPRWAAAKDARAYPWHPWAASTTTVELTCPGEQARRFVLEVDDARRRRLTSPEGQVLLSSELFLRSTEEPGGEWSTRPKAALHEPWWRGISRAELMGEPVPLEDLTEPLDRGCERLETRTGSAAYAFDPIRKLWAQGRREDGVWFQVFETARSPVKDEGGWRLLPTLVLFANGCRMTRETRAGAPALPRRPAATE